MSTNNPTALIIMPDSPTRNPEVDALLTLGYQPVEAANPEEALTSLSTFSHAFVLVDVQYDALALVEMVKMVDLNLPVLVLTDVTSSEAFFDLLKHPRMMGVCKPIDALSLSKAIERVTNLPASPRVFRRNSLRMDVRIPATFEAVDTPTGMFENGAITSLSVTGLFLETTHAATVGDLWNVHFQLPDTQTMLQVQARIVRLQDGKGYGMELVRISEEHQSTLRTFLVHEMLGRTSEWLVTSAPETVAR